MKVLNLQCAYQHSFEGWFASEDDFQAQLARDLIECPMCANKGIEKMPSAPRLNLGGHQAQASASDQPIQESRSGAPAIEPQQMPPAGRELAVTDASVGTVATGQAAFLKALRHLVANTEDVGERFANEARRMHYGDAEARSIRGQASAREAVELLEEGIEVMPLPMPAALKDTLQ